ncbi:MAG TPA: TIGR03118 family protein [Candidatus Acidoferrales bacterium]|nr:TIGR03118 family protein [Candidatus Acidoferrales bacterium]
MRKVVVRLAFSFSFVFTILTLHAAAQNVAYRQTNLASSLTTPGFAQRVNPALRNPAGVAPFLGQTLFVADTNAGRVSSQDATGAAAGIGGFAVPNVAGTGPGSPFAIVSDVNGLFGAADPTNTPVSTVITASLDGGIYIWGIGADGSFPTAATLVVDRSSEGAVYTGIAILNQSCCAPLLAVANFHRGLIEVFDTHLAPVGTIRDTSLPPGFAPYNLQVIGDQLFVASAMQDDAHQNPVFGAGNGFVSIFDLQGNFVRRFAVSTALNAPWSIVEASPNFGPLSNAILIGNAGDGVINAFDFASGGFLGSISDGDGRPISIPGLRGTIFGSSQFGDPNTLYFVAGINNGPDGLFASITTGLVSTTTVLLPPVQTDTPTPVLVTVAAAPGNTGTPEGNVIIQDNGVAISGLVLGQGQASTNITLRGIGTHSLLVQYEGDSTFLPNSMQSQVLVTGLPTSLTLLAPSNAAPGEGLVLAATISSTGGIPTGDVTFHDGLTSIGTAPLDSTGVATLRTAILAAGAHSLSASYAGDEKFAVSAAPAVTITISSADFSLSASPSSATVAAGQSTQFTLTVTPSGGFTGNVALSCAPITGITCAFNPATLAVSTSPVTSSLTLTVSSGTIGFSRISPPKISPRTIVPLLFAIVLIFFGLLLARPAGGAHSRRVSLSPMLLVLSLGCLSLVSVSCGKVAGSVTTNRGTAQVTVTAQSGAIAHTTTLTVTVQ